MATRPRRDPFARRARRDSLERLILDTTVLVGAERGLTPLSELVADEDDVVIAAITVAELLVGVELADSRRRSRRQRFVEAILGEIPIEAYDIDIARAHALLLANVRLRGRPRGAHDLMIAATAVARGRIVVTDDHAHFADLPGVLVRD